MSDVSVNSFDVGSTEDVVALMRQLMLQRTSAVSAPNRVSAEPQPNPAYRATVQPVAAEPARPVIQPAPAMEQQAIDDPEAELVAAVAAPVKVTAFSSLRTYLLVSVLLTVVGLAGVVKGNQSFGPEMYGDGGMVPAAEAAVAGRNYAVFDLNLNIRHLRDEVAKRLKETPDVILLGASHWQEAHAGLVKSGNMYNSHIHRDYWEDPLGVVEIWERTGRLPKRMIIAIRDKQFTPVSARTDFLWEPGIPYYRIMAERLGLPVESVWKTLPYDRVRALFSLSMLFENLTRWYNAPELPHVTDERRFKTLDTLMPDGSILWSENHKKIFTAERRQNEVNSFLAASLDHPPIVDPKGVEAFNVLLDHLKEKGVQVYLVHPPFNPEFYDKITGSKYAEGLQQIEDLTKNIAQKHGLQVFGGFNPHKFGCTADQYIDAEHANPTCLQGIFAEYDKLVEAEGAAK